MESISEFDEDDANIPRHRQHHFAEVFGLSFLRVIEFKFTQFGDAINNFGDIFTESFNDVFFVVVGIFDNIVQNGSN